MQLSNEQVEQFWEDGFIIVENLLDPDEVASLLAHAEWVASGKASHIPKGQLQIEPHVVAGEAQAQNYADSLRKMRKVFRIMPVIRRFWTLSNCCWGPTSNSTKTSSL